MSQWMSEMSHIFMHYGVFGLFILSFVEASFFPIPPYLLSVPMTLAKPHFGLWYALVGTFGSVLGGLFGYLLGFRLGRPLLIKFVNPAILKKTEAIYQRWGDWTTVAGGLTPIPYKIFAISAGVFRTRLATFIPASLFSRGIRFFGEAFLLMIYGRKVLKSLVAILSPTNLLIFVILVIVIILLRKTSFISNKLLPVLQQLRKKWLDWGVRLQQRIFPAGLVSWYLITGATLTAFSFLVFSKLASELLENELYGVDKLVDQWIISFRTDWFTKVMLLITNLGSTGWLIGIVLLLSLLGLRFHKRFLVLAIDIVALGALFLTELLKRAFQRPRPSLPWLTAASGYSFPSGHTLISFAIYWFLAYAVFRSFKHNFGKYVLSAGLLLLPILIGISRIYLGVHYLSDVLAGWTVAMGWVGTCVTGIEYLNSKKVTF